MFSPDDVLRGEESRDLKPDLKPIQDDVLRRVGRNLLLFQHIEALLKLLLASHKGGGTLNDYKERQHK